MVMTARALGARRPLPSATGGVLRVADGVTLVEDEDGSGAVFLWGMAAWCWAAGDRAARRLAAVQLVESKAARQRHVAAAFGVNEDSLILWRGEFSAHGVTALAGRRPGPKGPSKLTAAKGAEIGELRAQGLTLSAVAQRAGVSVDTVRRALARERQWPPDDRTVGEPTPLRVRRPPDDSFEHQETRAEPVVEAAELRDGRSVPLAGALIILPALAATGLLDAAARVYGTGRAGLRGLRALVLSMVYACLLDGLCAERQTNPDPVDVDRLLGLEPAPDVKTKRRRIRELARFGRSASFIDELARRHLEAHLQLDGILHFAGRVRAYHRSAEVADTDLARIRLSTDADVDARLFDQEGDGVLVWTTPPDPSMVDGLRAVMRKVRDLVGPDARPTVCFDQAVGLRSCSPS